MEIQIWSDVACPWCAVGRAHLQQALAQFEHADEVTVRWRSFELDRDAPAERTGDYAEMLAAKYRTDVERAQQMIDTMTERGAQAGVHMDFSTVRAGSTFDAHRLLHAAHEVGLQDALKGRLVEAYLGEGALVSDHDTLVALAGEVGMDEGLARKVLDEDLHAEDVRADEITAMELGISGVPFFVFDMRVAVSGAQPADVLHAAMQQALDGRASEAPEPHVHADGEVCGPDGCQVS